MAQVAPGEELHRQHLVALVKESDEDSLVSLAARMWLDVCEAAAEEAPSPLDGDALDDVNVRSRRDIDCPDSPQ